MDVKERLIQLGIKIEPEQEEAIAFALEKTNQHIKSVCNLSYVPEELGCLAVDMACGEFISNMALSGLLEGFDALGAIKTITEGDVSLSYYQGAEKPLEGLLRLLTRGEAQLYSYRKLRW